MGVAAAGVSTTNIAAVSMLVIDLPAADFFTADILVVINESILSHF